MKYYADPIRITFDGKALDGLRDHLEEIGEQCARIEAVYRRRLDATWWDDLKNAAHKEDPMEEKNGTNAASPVSSSPRDRPPADPLGYAILEEVIVVDCRRGTGDVERYGEEERVRNVRRYYSKSGSFLAERDDHLIRTLRDRAALAERRAAESAVALPLPRHRGCGHRRPDARGAGTCGIGATRARAYGR